jgi:hypothetical protein
MDESHFETLTIAQLLKRWSDRSYQNVLEAANKGAFGIYTEPCKNRTSYTHVDKKLMKHSEFQKLLEFEKKFPWLFEFKEGFERLPTESEVALLMSFEGSSIKQLIKKGKIVFSEFGNRFAFFRGNAGLMYHTYLLRFGSPFLPTPSSYKGYYSEEDFFVFVNQVEQFEESGEGCASSGQHRKPEVQERFDHLKITLEALESTINGNFQKEIFPKAVMSIVEEVQKIDPSFDPKKMPGQVRDFHLFCLTLNNRMFAKAVGTFQKYCKGKNGSGLEGGLFAWPNPSYSTDYFTNLENNR